MGLLRRWQRVAPQGVYALYEGGERVGPLPVIYSHYRRGTHLWEVLVPFENADRMRGLHIDELPPRTQLHGTLSEAVDPHQWHVEGDL
jgi:hypothetical protein